MDRSNSRSTIFCFYSQVDQQCDMGITYDIPPPRFNKLSAVDYVDFVGKYKLIQSVLKFII
jgi:hypothetical protein